MRLWPVCRVLCGLDGMRPAVCVWGGVCGCSVCVWGGVCVCGCGGTREEGARGAGPPLLWVCVGGGVLLSHTLAGAVPSALAVLASGFGKGKSGRVPAAMAAATLAGPDPARPGAGVGFGYRIADTGRLAPPPGGLPAPQKKGKGGCVGSVGPLVPVGSTPLRGVHLRSINPVVFGGPSHTHNVRRRTRLEAGFPLRCFQRLSLPNVANQPCSWRNNWHTRGSSVPVLSYWGQPFSILLRAQRIGTELSHDVLNPARVPL